jgi:AcrR family transcriptional regulator
METTPGKKLDRRQIRTKRQIRAALEALLSEKPVEKITIKELAERADIDRKTFYLHYESIMALLVELQEEILDNIREVLISYDILEPDFDALGLFRELNSLIERNSAFYRKMVEADHYGFFYRRMKDAMKEIVHDRHGRQAQAVTPVQMEVYLEYALAGVMAVYVAWLKDPGKDLEAVAQAASQITYGGIREVRERILGKSLA